MKAILHTQYGAPDLLQLKEVDKPAPRDNEVLIAILTWVRILGMPASRMAEARRSALPVSLCL